MSVQDCLVKGSYPGNNAYRSAALPGRGSSLARSDANPQVLPRRLDIDLIRGAGLTASEYTTMMHLSEAPNRGCGWPNWPAPTELSASRMTRLVDDLQSRGLVSKTTSSYDARGNFASSTPRGMSKMKADMAGSPFRRRTKPLLRLHRRSGSRGSLESISPRWPFTSRRRRRNHGVHGKRPQDPRPIDTERSKLG